MQNKSVYLAGPMSGLTFEDFHAWREHVSQKLQELGITCYSPSRHKEFLRGKGIIPKVGGGKRPLSLAKGILARDFNDVKNADLLFVNFLHSKEVSIGTCCEIAFAHCFRIPVVMVIEEGNCHDHDFLNEISAFKVNNLDEGIELAFSILTP